MIIKEGQRLVSWVTQYPEGSKYNYDKEGHLLLIAYNEPTNDEIRDFKENPVEFGLFVGEGLIFLLYKFKNWEWADCPYNTHLLTPDLKVTPSTMGSLDSRVILPIVFLDSTTGIVRGHRTVLLSPEFSKELLCAIEAQGKKPINVAQQSQLVRKLYQQYTVEAMVKNVLCRSVGTKWDEKLLPTTWQRN